MPAHTDPNVLAGAEHFEDAGIYRLSDTTAIVQTVDFFPPLVDDPYQFGRIAAANSLSDIYAMGGHPITALNIVAFPDKDLPAEVLDEILRGGSERTAAAGVAILGGHSLRDAEVKYGLSVTGTIHPKKIVTNSGAKPGDAIVLTKPIGSGVLTSAAKKGDIPESDLAEAIEVMTELNKGACEAMLETGVSAATDVTGFGLLGHAFEMANASKVTIEIEADKVPLLHQTKNLADKGNLTRAHKATRNYLGKKLEAKGTNETLLNILADAQTSGGLLISLPQPIAESLIEKLKKQSTPSAHQVGSVTSRTEHTIIVR